jgi:hypothetical protein
MHWYSFSVRALFNILGRDNLTQTIIWIIFISLGVVRKFAFPKCTFKLPRGGEVGEGR